MKGIIDEYVEAGGEALEVCEDEDGTRYVLVDVVPDGAAVIISGSQDIYVPSSFELYCTGNYKRYERKLL